MRQTSCKAATAGSYCNAVGRTSPGSFRAGQIEGIIHDAHWCAPRNEDPLSRPSSPGGNRDAVVAALVGESRAQRSCADRWSYLWLQRRAATVRAAVAAEHDTRRAWRHRILVPAGIIAAVGVVLDRARSAPIPRYRSPDRRCCTDDGWLVAIQFLELAQPLRPQQHLPELKPACLRDNRRCGPLVRRTRTCSLPNFRRRCRGVCVACCNGKWRIANPLSH